MLLAFKVLSQTDWWSLKGQRPKPLRTGVTVDASTSHFIRFSRQNTIYTLWFDAGPSLILLNWLPQSCNDSIILIKNFRIGYVIRDCQHTSISVSGSEGCALAIFCGFYLREMRTWQQWMKSRLAEISRTTYSGVFVILPHFSHAEKRPYFFMKLWLNLRHH